MKIIAVPIIARNLVAGDLFSTMGAEYWDHVDETQSIGERVYIRTNAPTSKAPDSDELVFRVTIER